MKTINEREEMKWNESKEENKWNVMKIVIMKRENKWNDNKENMTIINMK